MATTTYGDAELASTADDVIIRDELAALDDMAGRDDRFKRDIIRAAAEKLGAKYAAQPTIVAQRLRQLIAQDRMVHLPNGTVRQVYARVSKAYLYMAIQPEYRSEQSAAWRGGPDDPDAPDDAGPASDLERFLNAATGMMVSMAPALEAHMEQLDSMKRGNDAADRAAYDEVVADFDKLNRMGGKELADYLHEIASDELGSMGLSGTILKWTERLECDAAAIKKLSDRRVKFSTATRLLLRMIFMFRHYGDIAGKLNHTKKHGAKWLASIDKDEMLARFVDLTSCPHCHFDFELWMEQARERQARGLDTPAVSQRFCRKMK